jgi:hypothetical protein
LRRAAGDALTPSLVGLSSKESLVRNLLFFYDQYHIFILNSRKKFMKLSKSKATFSIPSQLARREN